MAGHSTQSCLERASSRSAHNSKVESVVIDRTATVDNKRTFAFRCPFSSFPWRRSCWLYLSVQLVFQNKLQRGCTVNIKLQSWTSLAAVYLLLIQTKSALWVFQVFPVSTACSPVCGSCWTLLPASTPAILTEVARTFHLLFKTNVGNTAWKKVTLISLHTSLPSLWKILVGFMEPFFRGVVILHTDSCL